MTLDVAEDRQTRQDRAYPVEQCVCPVGYRGLSCEVRQMKIYIYSKWSNRPPRDIRCKLSELIFLWFGCSKQQSHSNVSHVSNVD